MSLAIFKARLSHTHLKPRCERANSYEANVVRHAPRTFVVEHETGTLNSVRARVFDLAFGPLDIVIGQTVTHTFCPAKTPLAFKHYKNGHVPTSSNYRRWALGHDEEATNEVERRSRVLELTDSLAKDVTKD